MVPVPIRCRIPDILRSRGKDQQWLADITGLSKQRISDYARMRGNRVMSLPIAYKIATALNVDLHELYEWRWQQE